MYAQSQTGSFPPGSFPGGENLGLPPGLTIPGPFSPQVLLGLWGWNCSTGICVPGVDGISEDIFGSTQAAAETEILVDQQNWRVLQPLFAWLCSGNTGQKVAKGVRNGAISGAIRGGVSGGGIAGRSIIGAMEGGGEGSFAGPEGAAVGALAGAAMGAANGVGIGFAKAGACKLLGF